MYVYHSINDSAKSPYLVVVRGPVRNGLVVVHVPVRTYVHQLVRNVGRQHQLKEDAGISSVLGIWSG